MMLYGEQEARGASTGQNTTSRELEEVVSSNPVHLFSGESASGSSAPSTQTRHQNVRKAQMLMPYLVDYLTDSWVAAALRAGLDSGGTPLLLAYP